MDDYMKAITFNKPNEIPSRVSFLPATWTKYKDELETIVLRYNNIFKNYKNGDYKSYRKPETYNLGIILMNGVVFGKTFKMDVNL